MSKFETKQKRKPKSMKWAVIVFIIVLLVLISVNRFNYREDPNRHFITDKDGRLLIFHGINVISAAKSDPLRVGGTTKDDFVHIADEWGFNAVRLLIFWDGIEPQPGQYDQEYLARVRQRLDWCEEAGLYVILDMHQDLFSTRFGGDGAPEWAIHDENQTFEQQTPWELNYLQPAVRASINNFWRLEKGYPELQEHYIDAMMFALNTLADHPSVIGIDLYNEPTMANLYGLYRFERNDLTPFTQKAINAIRTKHNDLWIFFEPSALGVNQGFRSKLRGLTDPRDGEPRLVYFPHLYTLDLDIADKYAGWPLWISFWGHQRQEEVRRFGTPMMVGEFGLNENQPGALDFLRDVLAMYDKTTSGWFYWSYDRGSWGLQNQDGEENQKAGILLYPYPQKIAGTRPRFSWQWEERIFSLSFNAVTVNEQSQVTEIYLPPRSYPEGWKLINQGIEISQSFDSESNILSIQPQQPGEVRITIQAKGQ
jgi:endoglycosylceramidase